MATPPKTSISTARAVGVRAAVSPMLSWPNQMAFTTLPPVPETQKAGSRRQVFRLAWAAPVHRAVEFRDVVQRGLRRAVALSKAHDFADGRGPLPTSSTAAPTVPGTVRGK